MHTIRIDNFGGMIPRLSNRLLPAQASVDATNCKLFSGELRGWNNPLLQHTFALGFTPLSAYRIPDTPSDFWMGFEHEDTHVVRGPLVNDAHDRIYWSQGTDDVPMYNTEARIINSDDDYTLGIPAPDPAILTSLAVTPTGGTGATVTRVYLFTYLSELGEESAPSETVTASGAVDGTWTLSGMGSDISTDMPSSSDKPLTPASGGGTAKKHIYRTITSVSGQTTFFFVAEVDINTASYADNSTTVPDSQIALNNLLESYNWNTPPADLEGIIAHPGGFLVGFSGRDIYFSEPYRPHAWPAAYVISTEYAIMGLGVVGTTVGVMTQSAPYTVSGIHPSSMSLTKSTSIEPCLSKEGIVTLQDGIFYPSHNGIAYLTLNGAQVITRSLLTKEEWQTDFSPATLTATRYGTRYLAFEDANSGFIFDPQEPHASIVNITRNEDVQHIFTDAYTGDVYLLSGNSIYSWDPASGTLPISYSWKSKVFEFPKPTNLGAGMLKYNDTDFQIDPAYATAIAAVNAIIFATAPTNMLGGVNSRPVNDVLQNVPYLADLAGVTQAQHAALISSDLIDISDFEVAIANATITIWADERVVAVISPVKNTVFRLPAGFKAHTWQVEISSNTDVYSIALAETGKGLVVV